MTITFNGNTFEVETEQQLRAVAALANFPKPSVPAELEREIRRRIAVARDLAARLNQVRETLGTRYAAEFLLEQRAELLHAAAQLHQFEQLAEQNGCDAVEFYGEAGRPDLSSTHEEDTFFQAVAAHAIAFAV